MYICNMKPSISVIVPVLNREHLIKRCLDSILNQTVSPDEIIIVDNGSTDGTKDVAKEWIKKNSDKKIPLILIDEPLRGVCAARQKGLETAKSEFLLFFDSDDIMKPDLIRLSKETLVQKPETDVLCWPVEIHSLQGKVRKPPFRLDNPMENHLIHCLLRTHGYMARKNFIENAGGWKKKLPVWNDFELGFRLLLNNPTITGLQMPLVDVMAQEDSITGKSFSSKQGLWERSLEEMRKENCRQHHPEQKRIARIIDYRAIILASQYYKEGNKKAGASLAKQTLAKSNGINKMVLHLVYLYTGLGGRGAWRMIRWIY